MKSAKLLLAAHDAGGAQLISSWALAHPENTYLFRLEGPAVTIFTGKFGTVEILGPAELDAELAENPPDLVLTGTGWQSKMEMQVRASALRRRIRTAAYLDHWINYRERFGFPGQWLGNLPDEIWCPDPESLAICRRDGFPESRLMVKGNPYLDGIIGAMIGKMDRDDGRARKTTMLYVCEPISEHMGNAPGHPMPLGYDEFTALRYFFATLSKWGKRPAKVIVRPHPSERPEKYDGFLREFHSIMQVERSQGSTLEAEIFRAAAVIGCESMAMVVALKLGKKVFTSIPPAGRPCSLPFPEIMRIDDPSLTGFP